VNVKAGRLGLYDSGVGGLTVLAALRDAGVDADIVYFADAAHVPYGDKTDTEINSYLAENLNLLAGLRVDAVITACNTSCAVAQRHGWPATPFAVLDIIAAAGASLASSGLRRIGVVATAATVRSGAYGRAIRAHLADADVFEVPAPLLVPIVERGDATTLAARDAVREAIAQLPADLDALVYGCTHYPLLDAWFADALPSTVVRIDPARAQAAATLELIARDRIAPGSGATAFYTNGDPAAFEAGARRIGIDAAGKVSALVAR
jgi:glutamate racemase